MKEIKKGDSLLKFFSKSMERMVPIIFGLVLLGLIFNYYRTNDLDSGFIFGTGIIGTAIIAIIIEGVISWKHLNKP